MIRAPAEVEKSIKSVAAGSRAEKHNQRHLMAVYSPNELPNTAKANYDKEYTIFCVVSETLHYHISEDKRKRAVTLHSGMWHKGLCLRFTILLNIVFCS